MYIRWLGLALKTLYILVGILGIGQTFIFDLRFVYALPVFVMIMRCVFGHLVAAAYNATAAFEIFVSYAQPVGTCANVPFTPINKAQARQQRCATLASDECQGRVRGLLGHFYAIRGGRSLHRGWRWRHRCLHYHRLCRHRTISSFICNKIGVFFI